MGLLMSVSVYNSVSAYRAVEGMKQASDDISVTIVGTGERSSQKGLTLPKGNSLVHSLPWTGLCILIASRKQQFRWHS